MRIMPLAAKAQKPLPLFSTALIRQIEANAMSQISPHETSLMQRAGYALYRLTQATYPHIQNIWIIAGKGNNGGDAIVAASWLQRAGKHVHLSWLGDTERMSIDTQYAVEQAQAEGVAVHQNVFPPQKAELIIDGILGIGLDAKKTLPPEIESLIKTVNQHPAPVIAVDIPSGLEADTGNIRTQCIKADCTLTFLTLKPGLFTSQGRAYCGEIWMDNLDITPPSFGAPSYLFIPQVKHLIHRKHNTHKGSFGDVCVIGGATGMVGAALLASRTALAAGAGRVYTSLLPTQDNRVPIQLDINAPELMFRPWAKLPLKESTIACGCGGGPAIAHVLNQLLKSCPALVLDADALNVLAENPALQKFLRARKQAGMTSIITPHPLEAARLLNLHTLEIQADRIHCAQVIAERFQCTCVLKGSGTIIATPGQTTYINSSGNAALATAGTGDVLTGWIAGRISPFMRQQNVSLNIHELVAHAVWEHGHAADRWLEAGHQGPLLASVLTQWI